MDNPLAVNSQRRPFSSKPLSSIFSSCYSRIN